MSSFAPWCSKPWVSGRGWPTNPLLGISRRTPPVPHDIGTLATGATVGRHPYNHGGDLLE
jgi:hypothetical protein